MNIVYYKYEISGALDLPSCPLELINNFVHGFPTKSAPNFLQINRQSLEHDIFKSARSFHYFFLAGTSRVIFVWSQEVKYFFMLCCAPRDFSEHVLSCMNRSNVAYLC